jgi:hypothetical protein
MRSYPDVTFTADAKDHADETQDDERFDQRGGDDLRGLLDHHGSTLPNADKDLQVQAGRSGWRLGDRVASDVLDGQREGEDQEHDRGHHASGEVPDAGWRVMR